MNGKIEEKLKKHKAFWEGEEIDQPLIGYARTGNEAAPGYALYGEKEITPEDINRELYKAYYNDFTFTSVREDFPGDLFYTPLPDLGIPWMEVITGCPVSYSPGSRMAWAEAPKDRPEVLKSLRSGRINDENPWLAKLLQAIKWRVKDFPQNPVPPVLGRGPLDVLLTLFDSSEVVMKLFEKDQYYLTLLSTIADVYKDFFSVQIGALPRHHGGYVNRRGLWAPGPVVFTQEDGAALISPDMYEETICPLDRRVWDTFDYAMFHLHSSAAQVLLDALLECPELDGIELMIDPQDRENSEMVVLCAKIQEANKRLLISSDLPHERISQFIETLSPVGLAFLISTADPEKYEMLGK